MKRVYLSIDLDYWRHGNDSITPHQVERFFKRVFSLRRNVIVALHHHHLLDHINHARRLTEVINVDFHSDIREIGVEDSLNEGSWANFVSGRENMTFTWRYPGDECVTPTHHFDPGAGYCHVHHNPFTEPECMDWKKVQKRQGLHRLPWDSVVAIGVCLSPDWIGDCHHIRYPLEKLRLYDWLGRWQSRDYYADRDDCMSVDKEKGTGVARLRLLRPRCVV